MSGSPYLVDAVALSTGVLVAQLVLGPLIAGHGAQKLFGGFGGNGLDGTGGFFESLVFCPGRLTGNARSPQRRSEDDR